jgi:ubiquinone/menaquinone biosynthesis C-methylase UbiE
MLIKNLQDQFFASVYPRMMRPYERELEERKARLLTNLHGNVLEIGAGPGPNLRYCRDVRSWIGIEPNRAMHRNLRKAIQRFQIPSRIIGEPAELIRLPDASIDVVIGTLVLCSVTDPSAVLAEVRRLLKPGGRYLFLEHVRDPENNLRRKVQQCIEPLWKFCANGCCADLDALEVIVAAGFDEVNVTRFCASSQVIPWFLAPHIAGCATRGGLGNQTASG